MARESRIERLYPDLRAYARSLCGDPHEAEDLLHDTIERALRSGNRPRRREDLRPWMFRILRNLYHDELRKRRVRREYLAAHRRFSLEEACAADHADAVLIGRAFGRLRPETREILLLVDILGLKYAEAAAVLDVPQGTVMSRISRARRALLALIEDDARAAGNGKDGR